MKDTNQLADINILEEIYLSLKFNVFKTEEFDWIFQFYDNNNSIDHSKFKNSTAYIYYQNKIVSFIITHFDKIVDKLDENRAKKLKSIFNISEYYIEENRKLFKELANDNFSEKDEKKVNKYLVYFDKEIDTIVTNNNNDQDFENILKIICYIKKPSLKNSLSQRICNIYDKINDKKILINRLVNIILYDNYSNDIQLDKIEKEFCLNKNLKSIFNDFIKEEKMSKEIFSEKFFKFKEEFIKIKESKDINSKIKNQKKNITKLLNENLYFTIETFYYLYIIYLFKNNKEIYTFFSKEHGFSDLHTLSTEIGEIDINYLKGRILPLENSREKEGKYIQRIKCFSALFSKENKPIFTKQKYTNKVILNNFDFLFKILIIANNNRIYKTEFTGNFLIEILISFSHSIDSKKSKEAIKNIEDIFSKYYDLSENLDFLKQNSEKIVFLRKLKEKKFNEDIATIKELCNNNNNYLNQIPPTVIILFLILNYRKKVEKHNNSKLSNYFGKIKRKEECNNLCFSNDFKDINEDFKNNEELQIKQINSNIEEYENKLSKCNSKICKIKLNGLINKEEINKNFEHFYKLRAIIKEKEKKIYIKNTKNVWIYLKENKIINMKDELKPNEDLSYIFELKKNKLMKTD